MRTVLKQTFKLTEPPLLSPLSPSPTKESEVSRTAIFFLSFFFFSFHFSIFFFSPCAHSMWKFPDQESNLRCSSDNTKSLTTRPSGNSPGQLFSFPFYVWGLSKRPTILTHNIACHFWASRTLFHSYHGSGGLIIS